jgi:hypothetical protein
LRGRDSTVRSSSRIGTNFLVFVITDLEKDVTHTDVGMLTYAMRTLHAVEVHIRHSNALGTIATTIAAVTDETMGERMHLSVIPTTSLKSNDYLIGVDSLWLPKHHRIGHQYPNSPIHHDKLHHNPQCLHPPND